MDMTSYLLGKNGNGSNYSDDVASYLLGKNANSGGESTHIHSLGEFSMEGSTNSISGHCGRWYQICTDCGETVYAKGKISNTPYAEGEYESHELVVFNRVRDNGDGTYDYTLVCKNCNAKKTYRDVDEEDLPDIVKQKIGL